MLLIARGTPRHLPLLAALTLFATAPMADGLQIQSVTDGVCAIVGPLDQRDTVKLARSATFALIVIGRSRLEAQMRHEAVRSVTDQRVTHVINIGGQDHRWLGNGYWQAQCVTVIASAAAVADQQARAAMQWSALALGILHRGPGEAPDWLAERGVIFTGDIVRVDRLPYAGPTRYTCKLLAVFEAMAAFAPAHVVPGHGGATDLATARRDTCDFLVKLRAQIGALIEEGGSIIEAPGIDQSAWAGLVQFDSLAGRNAQATC